MLCCRLGVLDLWVVVGFIGCGRWRGCLRFFCFWCYWWGWGRCLVWLVFFVECRFWFCLFGWGWLLFCLLNCCDLGWFYFGCGIVKFLVYGFDVRFYGCDRFFLCMFGCLERMLVWWLVWLFWLWCFFCYWNVYFLFRSCIYWCGIWLVLILLCY